MKINNVELVEIMDGHYEALIYCNVDPAHFVAVTSNSEEGDVRVIVCQVFGHEQSPGGEQSTNSGLFVRGSESSVQVILEYNGREVDRTSAQF